MPTYGYRCTACKHEFERFQKITDDALTECENCSAPVKKIMYPVGIAFKGSGFYVNDSKGGGESKKAEAKTDSGSEGRSETKTETTDAKTEMKTESKPDTKTETKPAATEAKPATSTPAAQS